MRHEPIDYTKLAAMTVGYSPAALKNIVNEALLFALQDGRDALRWDDLWQAKLTEEIGLKQPVKYSPREKEMVAVHEAPTRSRLRAATRRAGRPGHHDPETRVRARPRGRQDVAESFLRTQKQILADIQISLAGWVAEDIWYDQVTSGPSSDLASATYLCTLRRRVRYGQEPHLGIAGCRPDRERDPGHARDRARRQEVDALLSDCRERVRNLLLKKRHVVEGVRDALLEREELVGDEIEVLMAELGEREPIESP